jgi:hypothetical protein
MDNLHLLVSTDESARAFRADFHRTLTELFEENFVRVCSTWCHERGVPFRLQGYGVPPARPSSYRFADRYEGEGWGWKTLTATRWASSAAHIDGTNVVSAEAWTWVHSPSFRATPLDLKGEAHEHFLAGVNQLIGHGWPYSPADADGLGWFFYASGALDDRNAWWPAMPSLTGYLQRLSAVLRLGNPVRDVLVYLPLDDLYAGLGNDLDGDHGGDLDLFKAAQHHLPQQLFATLREHGRDFDLFDDAMTDRIRPADAGVVIVASATDIEPHTRRWLQQVTDAGGTVIAIDAPDAVGRVTTIADLPGVLDEVCPPSSRLDGTNEAVGTVSRRGLTTDVHHVIKTGPLPQRVSLLPSGERAHLELWNPDTCDILVARSTATPETERHGSAAPETAASGTIVLEPYGAVLIVETDESSAQSPAGIPAQPPAGILAQRPAGIPAQPPTGIQRTREPAILEPAGVCTVTFPGEDAQPVTLPHSWEGDERHADFSGTAHYRFEFDVPAGWSEHDSTAMLRFGTATPWNPERVAAVYRPNSYRVLLDPPIGEIAEVRVNGERAAVVWAPPYALEVRTHIRPGRNVIELAVSNTTAPALAADEASAARAAEVRAVYGERFRYQDIDRALDGVRSGLLCVPTLELRTGA